MNGTGNYYELHTLDDRNSPKSRKLVYLADRPVKLLAVKRRSDEPVGVSETLVSDFRRQRVFDGSRRRDGAVFALSESRDRTGFRWNCWIGSGANGYHACRVADATCARSVHHAPIVSADCAYIFLIAQR